LFSFQQISQNGPGIQSQIGSLQGRNAGDAKFRCSASGKQYVHQSSFIWHRNMECGKEPLFQWPFCPLKSNRKSGIAAHIKCKHMQTFFLKICVCS